MIAWKTPHLVLYLARERASPEDVRAPDRPSADHEWVNGAGWQVPANLLDRKAAAAIDGMDRLQFGHLFDLENRVRALEGALPITFQQYRTAMINRWKAIYG